MKNMIETIQKYLRTVWWAQLLAVLAVILLVPFVSYVLVPFGKWVIASVPPIHIDYKSFVPGAISGFFILKVLYFWEKNNTKDSRNRLIRFIVISFPFTITLILEKLYMWIFNAQLSTWNTFGGTLIAYIVMEFLKKKKIVQ